MFRFKQVYFFKDKDDAKSRWCTHSDSNNWHDLCHHPRFNVVGLGKMSRLEYILNISSFHTIFVFIFVATDLLSSRGHITCIHHTAVWILDESEITVIEDFNYTFWVWSRLNYVLHKILIFNCHFQFVYYHLDLQQKQQ